MIDEFQDGDKSRVTARIRIESSFSVRTCIMEQRLQGLRHGCRQPPHAELRSAFRRQLRWVHGKRLRKRCARLEAGHASCGERGESNVRVGTRVQSLPRSARRFLMLLLSCLPLKFVARACPGAMASINLGRAKSLDPCCRLSVREAMVSDVMVSCLQYLQGKCRRGDSA